MMRSTREETLWDLYLQAQRARAEKSCQLAEQAADGATVTDLQEFIRATQFAEFAWTAWHNEYAAQYRAHVFAANSR
jgi:hypothetical protein